MQQDIEIMNRELKETHAAVGQALCMLGIMDAAINEGFDGVNQRLAHLKGNKGMQGVNKQLRCIRAELQRVVTPYRT